MTTQIITLLRTIFLLVLAACLVWRVAGTSDREVADTHTVNISGKSISSLAAKKFEPLPAAASDGAYMNHDKTRISVKFSQLQRLVIIQHMAEAAGFDFSLPDDGIAHWQELLTININNEPVQDALAKVIGIKNFNIAVSYNTATASHRISAVYLGGSSSVQAAPLSPVGLHEPIPFERDTTAAPGPELSVDHDSRTKRDNFFSADEATRIALLNEMSPVGEDLNYILTSLRQDEQVAVRIAAAQRLSFSENYMATQSLLDALSDKNEAVVKAAINSLVALGDSSVLPVMEHKLAHSEQLQGDLIEAKNRMSSQFHLVSDQQP